MTTLESTKGGMFMNENPTLEDKQIEVGHGKKPRVDAKEKKRKKKKEKRKKEIIELYHVRRYLWSNLM